LLASYEDDAERAATAGLDAVAKIGQLVSPKGGKGHRFDRTIRAWGCGEASEVVRKTTQLLLLGL
jgi:hypothetical protein